MYLIDFLCAGSSALFLAISRLFPSLWFISLFALVPIIWRAAAADLRESLFMGTILGGCFCLVVYPDHIMTLPHDILAKLVVLSLSFSLFTVGVRHVIQKFGLNPFLMAVAWLPTQSVLTEYGGIGNVLAISDVQSASVLRLSSLFGFLAVAVGIVLVNSTIALLLRYAVSFELRGISLHMPAARNAFLLPCVPESRRYHFILPILRGPPDLASRRF